LEPLFGTRFHFVSLEFRKILFCHTGFYPFYFLHSKILTFCFCPASSPCIHRFCIQWGWNNANSEILFCFCPFCCCLAFFSFTRQPKENGIIKEKCQNMMIKVKWANSSAAKNKIFHWITLAKEEDTAASFVCLLVSDDAPRCAVHGITDLSVVNSSPPPTPSAIVS
jgi:hypothetical protein